MSTHHILNDMAYICKECKPTHICFHAMPATHTVIQDLTHRTSHQGPSHINDEQGVQELMCTLFLSLYLAYSLIQGFVITALTFLSMEPHQHDKGAWHYIHFSCSTLPANSSIQSWPKKSCHMINEQPVSQSMMYNMWRQPSRISSWHLGGSNIGWQDHTNHWAVQYLH